MCDHEGMSSNRTVPLELARATSRVLHDLYVSRGVSMRELSRATGMSFGRVQGALSASKSVLVDDVDRLARALGTTASAVVRDAEGRLAASRVVPLHPAAAIPDEEERSENAAMRGRPGEGPSAYDEQ